MNEHSILFRRVDYQTSLVDGGTGLVVGHSLETGRVVVLDEDDGTKWLGYEEHVTVLIND